MYKIDTLQFYHIQVNIYLDNEEYSETNFNVIWKQKYKVEPYQGLAYYNYKTNTTTDNLGNVIEYLPKDNCEVIPSVVVFTKDLTYELKNKIITYIESNYDTRNGTGSLRFTS